MINNFRGDYYFLSNFYPCKIVIDGITYDNAEAAFQSFKCKNRVDRFKFSGINGPSAKKLGRKVELIDDWEHIKNQIMHQVLIEKFYQNVDLRNMLISTGDEMLVEGNKWHDNYWGWCTCDRCANKVKQNKLGYILMDVRSLYKIYRRTTI